ncbi:MAG: DHH family phosphoesterase [Thermoplasmatales archaeon]|nr:DHH family phosphoesterase [Thermoplasmatales archaeon]
MDESVLPAELLKRLSKAADAVRGHRFIHIFSHRDADGISSAAILAKALGRAGKEYQITLLKSLSAESFKKIEASLADCVIVADLGASYVKELEALGKDVVVLDHHVAREDSDRIHYVNPHLAGIDGMSDACGATMSFAFAATLDPANWDLLPLAFAGITGDRQHTRGLAGPNMALLRKGGNRGIIAEVRGSLVPPGPLSTSLYLSTDPYVRGVSGNPAGVSELLRDAGVDGEAKGSSLDGDSSRRLASLMALKLAAQGVDLESLKETTRPRYVAGDMDMECLAWAIDACGKSDQGGTGILACLGDEAALTEAMEIDYAMREKTVNLARKLDEKGLTQMTNFQYFLSETSGFTGNVCGIAMQYIGDRSKPTVALSVSEDSVKVSARGTHPQLERGVDLSEALRKAAESVGGEGGGHRIASGASFPAGREMDFLENLDAVIGDQVTHAT